MRWEEERYVRIYTRDTGDMILMGWEARALFYEIIRKADRAGILDLGKSGKACLGTFLHMPQEVVDRLLPILVENEMVIETPTALIVRNYIEAQESVSTPASRQRYSREYRRDMIRRGLAPNQRDCAVYFVQSEDGGPIKIGRADDVAHRLQQLQTSRPDKLVLLAAAPGTFDDERKIQEAFAQHRVKGEWFSPVMGLLELVKSISSHGSIPRDLSQFVTSLSVPYLSVPIRAVPNSDPDHCPSGRPDGPLFLFPGDAAPQKKTKRNYSRGFLDFWEAYPRRVGKLRAWKLWPGDDVLPAILTALEWQAKTESWNKDGGKFVPHPSTYLSQGRWEDEKPAGGDTSFAEALRIADERMGRKTP